jgi:glycosyltransferase involved in cell wall biosynthesis
VIVVDDGSTDDPAPIVGRYPQVRLIRQPNQGLAAARNTGWRAARGRYVVFLDDDDRLLPDAVASNLQRFAERPECAFVYGGYRYIDASGRHLDSPTLRFVGEDAYESFLKGNCVRMHAAVMYRRDRLEEVGGFDTGLRACEDYELYLRLARRYCVAAGSECIAEYRRHDSNMTHNIPLMIDKYLDVMRRQRQHFRKNSHLHAALKIGIREVKWWYARAQFSQALVATKGFRLRQIPFGAIIRVFARAPGTVVGGICRRLLKKLRSGATTLRYKIFP